MKLKSLAFVSIFNLLWIFTNGQDTLKVEYFDKHWNPVKADSAFLVRTTYEIDKPYASYAISIKRHDGIPFFDGEYSSLEPKVEEGSFKFFHNVRGHWVISKGYYFRGEIFGKWSSFSKDYQDTVDYNFELLQCSDTSDLLTPSDYKEWPRFDGIGAENGFYEYVNKEGYYPPLMQREKQHGIVYINFIVDRNGNVCNARVEKGLDNDLDAEALRLVVNSSGRWSPKTVGGKVRSCRMSLPVRF